MRDIEERKYELENRIRNLVWTVSGDYTLDIRPNTELFQKSSQIAVYDGVKQGGLAKYFDQDAVSMYLLKKVYCHADQTELLNTAQICTEEAVGWRLDAEREGIRRLREKAYNDVLDQDFKKLSGYPLGRLRKNGRILEGYQRDSGAAGKRSCAQKSTDDGGTDPGNG